MPCQDTQEDLQAYLDGELSSLRRAVIESHLAECSECRQVIAELRKVSGVLGGWKERSISKESELSLHTKIYLAEMPAEKPEPTKARAARRAVSQPVVSPPLRMPVLRWLTTGWRPVAAAAVVLLAAVVYLARDRAVKAPARRVTARATTDVLSALSAASTAGQVADGAIYAALVGKRAIASEVLDPARVASSDVVGTFLARIESESDKNVGRKLINMLAGSTHGAPARRSIDVASVFGSCFAPFGRDLWAAEAPSDPIAEARQYELEGRLKEALSRYQALSADTEAPRTLLAQGALMLRLGDLDGARIALSDAAGGDDKVAKACAQALLAELAGAEGARERANAIRATAVSAQDWQKVGLFEIEALDYRGAANSFMKAANAAGEDQVGFAEQARFRSAWCQKEVGQISTGVYGFKMIMEDARAPQALTYAAGLEQAVGLARVRKYAESVEVCRELVSRPAPDPNLEALAYFQKGYVELRDLKDSNAAAASLDRVSAAGQGNLSYAALVLRQSTGR